MPGLDWLPGISQLKSTVQLLTGDVDGAAKTQANFWHECPGFSQITSVAQLATGDADGAKKTQKRCLGTINNVVNATPVVGHVKGFVHYAVGDEKGGDQAMNAASRSAVVIGSGAVAGLTTGGLAAIPAGIAAGATYDTAATLITDKPQGIHAAFKNAVENPNAGNIIDYLSVPVGDGFGGHAGGNMANNIVNAVKNTNFESVPAANAVKVNSLEFFQAKATALGKQVKDVTSQINVIEHGTPKFWYDPTSITPNNTYARSAGYIGKEHPKKRAETVTPNCPRQSSLPQENAYSHDSMYIEYGGNCTTTADKENVLKKQKEQTAAGNLKNVYPNISVVEESDMAKAKIDFLLKILENQNRQEAVGNLNTSDTSVVKETDMKTFSCKAKKDFERNKTTQEAKEAFNANNWLHVPMPKLRYMKRQFSFTGAIMTNFPEQGLFHSLARHGSQWVAAIPNFRRTFQQLPNDIQNRLRAIENEPNEEIQRVLLTDLHTIVSTTADSDTMIRIHDLQMEIYRFLRDRVNYQNYLGEGVNTKYCVQYYFEAGFSFNQHRQVMVICPSNQLFSPDPNFGDSRPIRTITTIYFIPFEKFEELKISKMF